MGAAHGPARLPQEHTTWLNGLHVAPQELPRFNILHGVDLRIFYFAFCLGVRSKGMKGLYTLPHSPSTLELLFAGNKTPLDLSTGQSKPD